MLMLIGLFYIPQDVFVTTTYKLKLFSKRQAPISLAVSMAAVNWKQNSLQIWCFQAMQRRR